MSKHILVIDDQASMLSIISTMLKGEGFEVTGAQDGQEGLVAFNENPEKYSLIIADVNMPKIDGFEFLKKVRRNHPNQPVIFLTGVNPAIVQTVGEEYKVNAIITKPFDIKEALAVIKQVIG